MLNEAYNDAIDPALSASGGGCGVRGKSEPLEQGGFFHSGPIECRALSGPLDVNVDGGGGLDADASGLRRRIVL
ncbi:unnamed protein product [Citrullus colocynthis]|uniref:Uncharacterized protein n=1 Tax=Citrullus colocynthis TaxID=252529 RepID=A0ABP0YFS4_9ROSI